MKQPKAELQVCDDLYGDFWIDVVSDCSEHALVSVGLGRSKQAAWKAAARKLQKLADEAKKRSESEAAPTSTV